MKVLFVGHVPKDLSFPEANEDAYELAPDIGRIAISDGASESYDSRTWAKLIATRFVQHPEMSKDWLNEAIADYVSHFDPGNLSSWSKQAAFERGSFATLLGLEQCKKDGTLDVLAVGDSLAVLMDGKEVVNTFPYLRSEEFHQRPELFSTNATLNTFFAAPDFFSKHHTTWTIRDRSSPIVLCMTDALAEWALHKAEECYPMWETLVGINNTTDFEDLIIQERQARTMRIDDSTLVRITFVEFGNDELPLP